MSGNLAGLNFKASEHVDEGKYAPITAGTYDACIIASQVKPNSKGTGHYLELKVQIMGGKFANRILFDQLNLSNPNETAVQIAKAKLSSICRAVGIETPNDSSELHNKGFKIDVVIENDDQYGAQNKIKRYKHRHQGPQAPVTPAASAPAPVPAQQLGPPLMTGPAAPRNPFAAS